MVMTGLTSLVLTTWRAGTIATNRVVASGQIRSFQFEAYDDFALSAVPDTSGCNPVPWTCPIRLIGTSASNSATPALSSYQVTYTWDQTNHVLDRTVNGGGPRHAATNVSYFSWTVTPNQTVVVTLTVTMAQSFPPYSETQTFQFYPRVNP
jgi:hypothetical protein